MRADSNQSFGEGRGFEIGVVGRGGLEDQFVAKRSKVREVYT